MQLEGLPRHSLDPRRRRGDRRPPARPAGAALPRSALGHARHPVRHEICRGCGAGEVRLPRPEDAVGAAEGACRCSPSAASRSICRTLAWDDPKVSTSCSSRGNTVGVFQLESEGMRRTLAAVRPDCFEDIIALVSLYRPGPMDNIPMFGARKNGREDDRVSAPAARRHPEGDLRHLRLSGAGDAGGADPRRLFAGRRRSCCAARWARRSRPRWTRSASASSRAAPSKTSPRQKANELFDLIDKFAGYGFNKSHAAAYALRRLPDGVDEGAPQGRILRRIDVLRHGADRQAVDLRRGYAAHGRAVPRARPSTTARPSSPSRRARTARSPSATRWARSRAWASARWRNCVAERVKAGPFQNLEDFAHRIDPRLLNRRQLESLAAGGAFEVLGHDRATVFAGAETILANAATAHRDRNERSARPVRRRGGGTRADPPAGRAELVARRPDGAGEGGVRLLFLRAPDRQLSPSRPGARRAQLRRMVHAACATAAGAGRARPSPRGADRGDVGTGRGCALAHLRARAALS